MKLVFVHEPVSFRNLLGVAPDLSVSTALSGKSGLVLYFSKSRSELSRDVKKLAKAIQPGGILWIAWPKKASGVETDLTENVLREILLPIGLVDVKVCAIDATWSGLKFVWRIERRSALKL
jgi:hypothetical protein